MSDQQSSNETTTSPASSTQTEAAVRYVGFWARVVASIVDTISLMIVMMPLAIVFGIMDGGDGMLSMLLQFVFPAAVIITFWFYKSATPGKMLLDAIIVDANTLQPASRGQLVGRYFAYIPSGLIFFLGYIWVGFDSRKQGWHDKMAGTVVIKKS